MARILTRPLFRKGGLSRETGIMSGLDSPRRSYAGGGNIGGGRFTGTPMGSRTGFQTTIGPQLSDIDRWKQRIRGTSGGLWDAIKNKLRTTGTQSGSKIVSDAASKVSKMRWPWLSEKGLLEAGKKVAGKGAGIASGFAQRFPKFGGPATALTLLGIKSGMIKPTEAEEEYGVKHWEKALASSLPGAGGEYLPAIIRKTLGLKKKEDVPEEKIIESDIDTPTTGDVESDFERIYKERLPTIEKALAGRPSTKSQWLALAKFGTGLMAQPGGDLIGAIGKASRIPLDDLAKLQEKMENKKTQAKLLALQSALDETKPGDIAKKARDVKKLLGLKGPEGDKAAFAVVNKWLANDRTYKAAEITSYREIAKELNVNAAGFIESMDELKEKHPKLVSELGRTTKPLPDIDDLEDDATPGEYYINKKGKIFRYDPNSPPPGLLEPGDDGFEGKLKKQKQEVDYGSES